MSESAEYIETLDVGGQDGLVQRTAQLPARMQQQQEQQQAFMEFTATSSTSAESSVSSTSSDESDESESDNTLELAKITNEVLNLPRGLCENPTVFNEFFSLETWQELPFNVQNHLQKFLPNFSHVLPPQLEAVEQARTLSMLFTGDLQCFGQSPLAHLQQQLEAGNCRPDIKKLRENIKKSQRRERKFQNCERISHMAKQLFISRQRLLNHAHKSLPEVVNKAPQHSITVTSARQPKPAQLYRDNKISAIRARKRFYHEITNIAKELGMPEDVVLSADENDNDRLLDEEMKKDLMQQLRSSEENADPPKANLSLAERCVYSTVFRKCAEMDDEDAFRMQQKNRQLRLNNHNFKEYLREHKRRKLTEPTLPEMETSDIRLRDVCARAQMGGNFKRLLGAGKPGRKPKSVLNAASTSSANAPGISQLPTILKPPTTSLASQTLLPPPIQISEPPALVPIQANKKSESYQLQTTHFQALQTTPPNDNNHQLQQHQQQTRLQSPLIDFNKSHHNSSNDTLNISSFMSGHADNLNLCMDDSSLLTGDHDAFTMLDSEVELQQEEVETFAGSSDDNLTNFVIGDDIVLGSRNDSAILQMDNGQRDNHHNQQTLPKLEPIMRSNNESISKLTHKLGNNKKSPVFNSLPLANCTSELIQETHASFFSLIRDFFCSTPNHRMRYDDLKSKIDIWLRNPITALNEWYAFAENWSNLLRSAINFLVGDFPDLPEEYVPFIEHKIQLNIYQWIGAGRDSDTRLTELCNAWMDKHKHPSGLTHLHSQTQLMKLENKLETLPKSVVESEDPTGEGAALSPPPPPPRYPTNWTVRAATIDEIMEFQRQERERFEQPHKAYTYHMHGYKSVVGPVKGIYTPLLALTKARGHSMMVGDRPNFVTILTLVRDATARLPNGEGTRADISELLKCSQYINRDAAENVLQTIVSGALDRMHTEEDPCVRYDPKRKIWIYLHRNRTEQEFEKIHQQNQISNKSKKMPQRKPRPPQSVTLNTKLNSGDQDTPMAESTNGTLLTLPALVPSNPIIVSNTITQRQQHQVHQNKCPPVPPLKYNIPPTTQMTASVQQQQQLPQYQQKSLLKTTVRQETKTQPVTVTSHSNKLHTFQVPQAKSNTTSNTTPIIVATPQGLQTVHVSNATSVMPATNHQGQQQPQHTPVQQTNLTANLAGKRVMLNKPIIINQVTNQQSTNTAASSRLKSTQQMIKQQNRVNVSQQQQQSNIITIPISMANNMTINTASEHNVQQVHSPSLASGKQNIIRLVPAGNVKTLLSPSGQIVNRQRILSTNLITSPEQRSNTPQQQHKTSAAGIQLISNSSNVVTTSSSSSLTTTGAGSIVKMSAQAFAALQQKQAQQQQQHQSAQQQQQQHIIVKQGSTGGKVQQVGHGMTGVKTQRVILGNTAVMAQSSQNKNVVLQQIPMGASSVVVTPTNSTATVVSSTTTLSGGNRIQTINTSNLTPQQQRILIQNLKQQQQQTHTLNPNQIQYKTVQVVGSAASTSQTQQHNLIQRPQTITVAAAASPQMTQKTLVMASQDNGTPQQLQQNITRILKTSPQMKTEASSNLGSRVITNSSGQIISLDSLIQKQGGALRITGSGNTTAAIKTNVHQPITTTVLQKVQQQQIKQQPQQQQQQQQYAIVSVPNSIISLSNSGNFTVGQRIITTQASTAAFNTTMANVNATTKVTPGVTQRRIVTTSGGTKIITKAPASVAGNIRVLNTTSQQSGGNINLTTLQGKQVMLASGKTMTAINKAQQQNIVQTASGGNIVIGGQTIKLQQGNTNIQQILNKSGNIITAPQASNSNQTVGAAQGQMQTVIMGNQILRVQQMPQIVTSANRLTTNVINNKTLSSSESSPKTIFVGTGGQTLRLQSATSALQTGSKNIIVNTNQHNPNLKTATSSSSSTTATTPNRVVLAVQGGGQIFLSPNFQGGNVNLKALQNLKMVSVAQAKEHLQQQTSAASSQTQAILKATSNIHHNQQQHSTANDANV